MRRSYSFDDFKRELVFRFYAQAENLGRSIESCESCGTDAKRDDSGTAAARFFGTDPDAPVELFARLRAAASADGTGTTSLDTLWQLLIEQSQTEDEIPYYKPQVEKQEDRMEAQKLQYATRDFKTAVLDRLAAVYPKAYESMKNAQATTVWGLEQGEMWPRPKFKIDVGYVLVIILGNALKDWQEIHSQLGGTVPEEWGTTELYAHAIYNEEMLSALKEIGFKKAYKTLTGEPPLTCEDLQLRLYEWFQEALFGATPQGAIDPNFEYGNRKYIWRPQDGLRTPETWRDSLQAVHAKFEEEMAKQNEAANHADDDEDDGPATSVNPDTTVAADKPATAASSDTATGTDEPATSVNPDTATGADEFATSVNSDTGDEGTTLNPDLDDTTDEI